MNTLGLHFTYYLPNPLYWYSTAEQKEYILFTPWSTEAPEENLRHCLLKYDISSKQYHIFAPYNKEKLVFKVGGNAINTATDEIYLFGGYLDVFAKFNLLSKQWRYYDAKECNFPASNMQYPSWCMVSFPHNQQQLHIYHGYRQSKSHYRFNETSQQFEQLFSFSDFQHPPPEHSRLLCINNTLILLAAGTQRNIYTCKLTDISQSSFEWRLTDLELPENMQFRDGYKCIVAFDCVLIIFRFTNPMYRWYLDLGDLDSKPLSEKNYAWVGDEIGALPEDKRGLTMHCVLTPSGMVHWFYLHGIHGAYHSESALDELIPRSVCDKYNGCLVFGYVHEMERKRQLKYQIPSGIVQLILMYY